MFDCGVDHDFGIRRRPRPIGDPVGEAIAGLHAAIDASLQTLTGTIDAADLWSGIIDVIAIRNRFAAPMSQYFWRLESSGELRAVGAQSAGDLVAQRTKRGPSGGSQCQPAGAMVVRPPDPCIGLLGRCHQRRTRGRRSALACFGSHFDSRPGGVGRRRPPFVVRRLSTGRAGVT